MNLVLYGFLTETEKIAKSKVKAKKDKRIYNYVRDKIR